MGLYSGGLIIGRIFVSEIWGAYFLEAFYLFFIFTIIIILVFNFLLFGMGVGAYYRNFKVPYVGNGTPFIHCFKYT